MSRKILLPVFAAVLLPFSAQTARAGFLQPFASIDYYLHDGIEDDINQANNDAVNSVPAGLANGEVMTTNGVGGRLGLRVPLAQRRVDVGASYSYIKGPSIDSKIETPAGNQENDTDTFFSRIMGEVGVNFPVSRGVKFRVSGGAGVGHARVENHESGSGVFSGGKDSVKESSGFTWEISPAFVFGGDLASVEVGVRYAQFAPVDKTNDTPRIEWTPFGFYVGVSFF